MSLETPAGCLNLMTVEYHVVLSILRMLCVVCVMYVLWEEKDCHDQGCMDISPVRTAVFQAPSNTVVRMTSQVDISRLVLDSTPLQVDESH